jgi:uncharacterized membrane protein YdjX (TVP38/TMEM64 family)
MTPATRKRLMRLGLLAALIVTILVVAELTGLRKHLTIAKIREMTLNAGAWGVALYTLAFIVGEIIHVPGLLFVCAGVAIWGKLEGGFIAWIAAALSITASFVVVRAVGGRALEGIEHPFMKRMFSHLEERPIRTVALLRAILVISPPVTYALALSPVRFAPFFIGSLIGLAPPMALAAIFFEYLLRYLGA